MSLSSILAIGVSGINAQATSLEGISNNIANATTVGFRQTRTDFSALVSEASTNGGQRHAAGNGVSTTTRSILSDQGQISRTNQATNLAIAGEGFFVVSENANATTTADDPLFTRAGDFTVNSTGNLVNGSGFFLLGTPIPANGPATVGGLNSLQPINVNNFTGNAFTGSARATSQISIDVNVSTLAPISAQAALYNAQDPNANLAGGAVTPDFRQSLTAFRSDGTSQPLTLSFLRLSDNEVAVEVFSDDPTTPPLATGTLIFNDAGQLDPTQTTLPETLVLQNSQTPITLDLSGVQQTASETGLINLSSDGAPFGTVTGYDVGADGILKATLSNGLSENLFQISVASFTNANGLTRQADTAFRFDPAAGAISLTVPGADGNGQIEASAIENSTVDIARAFSSLIETQRAYSASARIISTADELYETLRDTAS